MAPETGGRVGILILRAWREGSDRQLRVRVTYRPNVVVSRQVVAAATSADEICDHVRDWLAAFYKG